MKWTKPSGVVVETNDLPETIEYCKSLEWKTIRKRKVLSPPKKTVKKK